MSKAEIKAQIAALSVLEVLVETNEGTYSAVQACDAVGSGDPIHATYWVYTQVGSGYRRRVGCDPRKAPGYARYFAGELRDRQAELDRLCELLEVGR